MISNEADVREFYLKKIWQMKSITGGPSKTLWILKALIKLLQNTKTVSNY